MPISYDIVDAFLIPNRNHFSIGQTVAEIQKRNKETVARVMSDYFTTGVAFFANRGHDKYLQEVGTTTWLAVNQRRVLTAYCEDMIGGAMQLGVPLQEAINNFRNNDEPHVILLARNNQLVSFVLLPPNFIVRAQNKPIEALATMAWICSQVRDMVNGRMIIDVQNVNSRASATEAQFLLEAVRQHPETILDPLYREIMAAYPQGIQSLPANCRYQSNSTKSNLTGLN